MKVDPFNPEDLEENELYFTKQNLKREVVYASEPYVNLSGVLTIDVLVRNLPELGQVGAEFNT
jgi:hypothetical protein